MPSSFLTTGRPPRSPPFPYATLFRSRVVKVHVPEIDIGLRHSAQVLLVVSEQRDRKSTRLNSSHSSISYAVFFFNDRAPTEISPLSLRDALPISRRKGPRS